MTSIDNRPDVAAFVAEVRTRLADLSVEERDDLLDGLEADLADQLAEGGAALPDPASYAAELRAAAGLQAAPRRRLLARGPGVAGLLDAVRTRWDEILTRNARAQQAWSVVAVLQPAWWALRAWVAVTMLDQLVGGVEPITLLPTFLLPPVGLAVLVLAVVVSVLIGQGRLWPGSGPERRTSTRVLLVVLNLVAVASLLSLAARGVDLRTDDFAATAAPTSSGVVVQGREVRNIYPYDAQGQPLTGVQLFDGAGRPIALSAEQASSGAWGAPDRLVGCPWVNGTRRLYNVFPLPERVQRLGPCRAALDARLGPGVLPVPPLTQVPPATVPTTAP